MQLWQAKAAKKKKYKNQYSQLSYVTKETEPWKKTKLKKRLFLSFNYRWMQKSTCQTLSVLSWAIHHLPFGMLLERKRKVLWFKLLGQEANTVFWNYFQDFQKVLEVPHIYRSSCELEKWNYTNLYCNLKAVDIFTHYYFLTHFLKPSSPRDQWEKKQAGEIKEPKALTAGLHKSSEECAHTLGNFRSITYI